ncbi:hypothetical protein pb186bvf_013693 [Paramecium bursaria]
MYQNRNSHRGQKEQVQNLYNLKPKPPQLNLGHNPFVQEERIQIKVFQNSTKSSLDKKSYSQEKSLQSKLFDESNNSFISSTHISESERQSQYSPRRQITVDYVTIKLHKQPDKRFYDFIKEYGLLVEDKVNTPPPQKSFRTKLFNH